MINNYDERSPAAKLLLKSESEFIVRFGGLILIAILLAILVFLKIFSYSDFSICTVQLNETDSVGLYKNIDRPNSGRDSKSSLPDFLNGDLHKPNSNSRELILIYESSDSLKFILNQEIDILLNFSQDYPEVILKGTISKKETANSSGKPEVVIRIENSNPNNLKYFEKNKVLNARVSFTKISLLKRVYQKTISVF